MGSIYLDKGKKYKIKVQWSKYAGSNSFKLLWRKPQHDKEPISLWSKAADEISYFVTVGNNMDQIISGYRALTGKATMLPKWSLGFWQSGERYKSEEELLSIANEFRTRKVSMDVLVQDLLYWGEINGAQMYSTQPGILIQSR